MVKGDTKKYLLASTAVLLVTSWASPVTAKTYLETDRNYYTEAGITRGFLDQEISPAVIGQTHWDKFQIAVAKDLVTYRPGMTFNEYYLANGLSPEDNFTVYPGKRDHLVALPNGKPGYWNANPDPKGATYTDGSVIDYLTYVGPTDDRGAYWNDKVLEDPVLFSRLTVGTPAFGVFPSGQWRFPSQIGYGEGATVNDYMLTPENDIVIPTRFNTKREDVYLTMRSRAYMGSGIRGAQAYLKATHAGGDMVGSRVNPQFYVDTSTNIYMTDQAYEQLGLFSKIFAPSAYTTASRQLRDIGVDRFTEEMNKGLASIQAASSVNTIVSGNGGQIQLKGFDRQSAIDSHYAATETERAEDALRTVNVTYYMYTSGDSEVTLTTPLASNGKHLYSPNESVFKMETTRPYFSGFGDTSAIIQASAALNDFDNILGLSSFTLTDTGIKPDGEAAGVDASRVRVRVSSDGGASYDARSYTLDELKADLEAKVLPIGQLTLAYTYAATDAQDAIIGQLPSEIANNTGAYAVPFTRVLDTSKRYRLTYQFASEDSTTPLPTEVTNLIPVDANFYATGDSVTFEKPSSLSINVRDGRWEFVGYPSDTLTFANQDELVTGLWRFIPIGSIEVTFLDEQNSVLKVERPVQFTNLDEGSPYDVTSIAQPIITVGGKTYTFVGVTTGSLTGQVVPGIIKVILSYKEEVPPMTTGSLIIRFEDEDGQLLKFVNPTEFTNRPLGTPYDVTDLVEATMTVNGKTYTFVGVKTGSLTGQIAAGNMEVTLSYKEEVTTPPSSSVVVPPSSSSSTVPSSSTTAPSSSSTLPSSSSRVEPSSDQVPPTSSSQDLDIEEDVEGDNPLSKKPVRTVIVRPNGELPKTGEDTSNLAPLVIAFLSFIAGIFLILFRKKNKKEDGDENVME